MKQRTIWIGLALVLALAYAGRLAWRAHKNIVTLNVHKADLRKVVSSLRWQTWERIYVQKGIAGEVTLNVTDQPLAVVLNIINEQIEGRWTTVYPLYTSRKSLKEIRAIVRGEVEPPLKTWTNWSLVRIPFGGELRQDPETGQLEINLSERRRASADGGTNGAMGQGGFGGRGGFGGFGSFGGRPSAINPAIQLKLESKTPLETASLLRRESGARVVPEDGTHGFLTMTFENIPLEDALDAVTRRLDTKWKRFFVIERGGFGFGRRGPEQGTNAPGRFSRREPSREELLQRLRDLQAGLLPPRDTNWVRTNLFAGNGTMQLNGQTSIRITGTPPSRAEMEKGFQQRMADPNYRRSMAVRMLQRLANSTPEQRANRDLQRLVRDREFPNRQKGN